MFNVGKQQMNEIFGNQFDYISNGQSNNEYTVRCVEKRFCTSEKQAGTCIKDTSNNCKKESDDKKR